MLTLTLRQLNRDLNLNFSLKLRLSLNLNSNFVCKSVTYYNSTNSMVTKQNWHTWFGIGRTPHSMSCWCMLTSHSRFCAAILLYCFPLAVHSRGLSMAAALTIYGSSINKHRHPQRRRSRCTIAEHVFSPEATRAATAAYSTLTYK